MLCFITHTLEEPSVSWMQLKWAHDENAVFCKTTESLEETLAMNHAMFIAIKISVQKTRDDLLMSLEKLKLLCELIVEETSIRI